MGSPDSSRGEKNGGRRDESEKGLNSQPLFWPALGERSVSVRKKVKEILSVCYKIHVHFYFLSVPDVSPSLDKESSLENC